MFVVRVSGGQLGDVGMFKRIVPGDFLSTAIDFVTVVKDAFCIEVEEFPHIQHDVTFESHLTFELRQSGANHCQDESRVLDAGIAIL